MALGDVQFVENDVSKIEAAVISLAETLMSIEGQPPVKLQRIDPRRLMMLAVSLIVSQLKNDINDTGKQNLLYFSRGNAMDHIGLPLGVYRLNAASAITTLRFTISEPTSAPLIIPAGTRATPDGALYFSTKETKEILPGESFVDIAAECLTTGTIGNGWLVGQINQPVDRIARIQSISNTTTTSGGADEESDENLRERIQLAPESFSVAGATNAYIFWARTANQNIGDVAVVGPTDIPQRVQPGNVEIFPLLYGGELPTQDILDLVYETCNAEDIRPLTDFVHVKNPIVTEYNLNVIYYIDRARSTQAVAIRAAVEQAVEDWVLWQKSKMGRDINPSELNHRMVMAGAKRTIISAPVFQHLLKEYIGIARDISVTFGGLEDG